MNLHFKAAEEVKEVLDRYFNAVYNADIDNLKSIFHKSASMYGYLGSDIVTGTPQIFLDDLSSKSSMASEQTECKYVVESIQVTGDVACASIFVDGFFGAATIKDFFHLIKEDGQWYIVCKTFTTV